MVDHVDPVGEGRRAVEGLGRLLDSLALPGEGGFGHHQCRRLDESGIGGHRVALLEQEDVPRHHVDRRDPLLLTVPEHTRRRCRHSLQCGHGLLGPGLLHIAQDGVEDDDRQDHDGVEGDALGPFGSPSHDRDDNRDQQQVDQWACQLGEQLAPHRHRGSGVEPVRPRFLESSPGLLGAQSLPGVSAHGREHDGGRLTPWLLMSSAHHEKGRRFGDRAGRPGPRDRRVRARL